MSPVPDSRPFELEVDGTTVRGASLGSGTPLVLIHGWTLDQRIFRFQVPALSGRFRVITYDRRGCGRSEAAASLAGDVDDLHQVIDRVAGEPAHVLGMSQGGRIALRYMVLHPDRLRSAVLQGPALDQFSSEEAGDERVPLEAFRELAKQGRLDELRRRWRDHVMMSAGVTLPEARALIEVVLADYDGGDLLQLPPDGFDFQRDMASALRACRVPTLLITGALETASRRAHSDRIRALLPDCRECLLEHSGHMSNLGETDRYNRAVLEFCAAR